AVRIQAAVAVAARAAGADARNDDPVADVDVRDGGAHLGHRADALVAQNAARGDRRDVALEDVQIGAADRGRVHPHEGVRGLEDLRIGDRIPRLLARAVIHQRFHVALLARPRGKTGALPLLYRGWTAPP